MEDDRAEVDLGVAVDVEERLEQEAQKLPKRRFVGRKQAAEAASNSETNSSESKGTIQGISNSHRALEFLLTYRSFQIKENTSNFKSSPTRNPQ